MNLQGVGERGAREGGHHLRLDVVGHGQRDIAIHYVLNGGYAGRDTDQVQHHVDELAELGVPAPNRIPTLYPLSAGNAVQTGTIQVQHGRTSGEAEWALIVGTGPDDLYVTAACDHTDRALEVHGVAWSKQAGPDIIGDRAWPWADVAQAFDDFTLTGWVRHGAGDWELIQDGSPALLLPPTYWVEQLGEAGLLRPGTLVMSGTIPMIAGVDQFADGWRVELAAPDGTVSRAEYSVEVLAPAWE